MHAYLFRFFFPLSFMIIMKFSLRFETSFLLCFFHDIYEVLFEIWSLFFIMLPHIMVKKENERYHEQKLQKYLSLYFFLWEQFETFISPPSLVGDKFVNLLLLQYFFLWYEAYVWKLAKLTTLSWFILPFFLYCEWDRYEEEIVKFL